MKNFYFFILILSALFFQTLFAQKNEVDVLYLKNGKTITGKIIERVEDRTIIIETSEGTDFIDLVDISRIEKELVPRISSVYPLMGGVGTTVTILGENFGKKTDRNGIMIGGIPAPIKKWTETQIQITIPELPPQKYFFSVVNGIQKDISKQQFDLTYTALQTEENRKRAAAVEQPKAQPQPQYVYPEEKENKTAAFIISIAYAKPQKEFAATEGDDAGFAKAGYAVGMEGRIAFSDFIYMPIEFQMLGNELNIDELQKKTGYSISSDNKAFTELYLAAGLGFAIHLAYDTYLFGSYSYGYFFNTYPDMRFEIGSNYTQFNSAEAESEGKIFAFGITSGAATLGYKVISTNPEFEISYYASNNFSNNTLKGNQPITVALFYFGLTF